MSPRETILLRRARFCAMALAGAGLAGCGDNLANAETCLLVGPDTGTLPEACLVVPADSAADDSVPETGEDATDAADATDALEAATDTPSDG
ncbi:MAG: hypothetical protein JNL79_09410 [Myxococcales bacterium]|nr:hypothetical protein [Myxococcales bacterium]